MLERKRKQTEAVDLSENVGNQQKMKEKKRGKYRKYDYALVRKAYDAVMKGMGVRKAARTFSVPMATLHDRVKGRVGMDCEKAGADPLLPASEEENLVARVQSMVDLGYSFTRADVINLATDLVVQSGRKKKKNENKTRLSLAWFYGFVKRWPNVKLSNTVHHKKQQSETTVAHYFNELEKILDKHDLRENPHRIYSVSDVLLSFDGCTDESTASDTAAAVLGAGNVVGMAVPPYFVFPESTCNVDLLSGASPGAAGIASPSADITADVIKDYLQNHFVKYSVPRSPGSPLLLLYESDKFFNHVPLTLTKWAQEQNIVLFALPAHCSDSLKPISNGCFREFAEKCLRLCQDQASPRSSDSTNMNLLCRLGCKSYNLSFIPENLHLAFKKCGIFPFDRSGVSQIATEVSATKTASNTSEADDVSAASALKTSVSIPTIAPMATIENVTVTTVNPQVSMTTASPAKPSIYGDQVIKVIMCTGETIHVEESFLQDDGEFPTPCEEVVKTLAVIRRKGPRKQKKKARGRYHKYDYNAIRQAYDAVLKGMPLREAARTYSVPMATLHDRVKGRVGIDCTRAGKAPLLSVEGEKSLVDRINSMTGQGYSVTRADVISFATDIAIQRGVKTGADSPLTQHWFYSFLSRWPDLHLNNDGHKKKKTTKSRPKQFSDLEDVLESSVMEIGD